MHKGSLTLAQLIELLNTAKLAEGKSQKTCDWYEKSIEGYAKWLARANSCKLHAASGAGVSCYVTTSSCV
jgi:site-specific recombinase XerD